MLRILWFFLLIAIVVFASLWIAQHPGTVEINWFGREVSLSTGIALLVLLIFTILVIFTFSVLRGLWRSPGSLMRVYKNNKRSRGYKALTLGMVAVAAGDPDEARKQSKKADVLLNEPPLTMLLQAQAAQLNGDENAARKYFIQMLDNEETAFLGLRGLTNQAIKKGDRDEALKLAYKAKKLRPDSKWVFEQLHLLEANEGHYSEALEALQEAQSRKLLPKEESKHKQAVVLTQIALEKEKAGDLEFALNRAIKAVNRDPSLVAAQEAQARLYVATNRHRKAAAAIEKAWKKQPHPDLVPIYFDAKKVSEAMDKYKAGEKLFAINENDPVSLIAKAETALAADLWGEAKHCLEEAIAKKPSEKAYKLLAKVERAEGGSPAAITAYLEKAASIPQESIWLCQSCSEPHKDWQMLCSSCGTVDSLKWRAETLIQNRPKLLSAVEAEVIETAPDQTKDDPS
jgi:HemY protein